MTLIGMSFFRCHIGCHGMFHFTHKQPEPHFKIKAIISVIWILMIEKDKMESNLIAIIM